MSNCCRSILLAGVVLAIQAQVKEPFFFIHGSDPQIGWCESWHQLGTGFAQDKANFEFVIAQANRLHPAFLVLTGDLVDDNGNAAELAEYLRIAKKLDPSIPLYNVPGNHDVLNEPTPESLAAYRKTFGPDYYTFRVGGMAAFVLDSQLITGAKNVPEEASKQEAWLRRELAKAKQDGMRELVVFQHHLPFIASPGEEDTYYTYPRERRQKYLDLFSEYGVGYVFSGHYHRVVDTTYGSLKLATATAVSCADDRSGIRIVTVTSTGLESRSYDFGVIPTRVELRR